MIALAKRPERPAANALRLFVKLVRNARACPEMVVELYRLAFWWLVHRLNLETTGAT